QSINLITFVLYLKSLMSDKLELVNAVIKGMQEKKAKEIVCLDLQNTGNASCDFFIICHGDSSTQVDAIARSIEEEVRKVVKEKPWHSEGYENSEWILLDYVNVVAHVFYNETRTFFDLEGLWADAKVEKYEYQV